MGRRRSVGLFAVSLSALLLASGLLQSPATAIAGRSSAHIATTTAWPFLGFDAARTGFNPYETVLGPSNVSSLVPFWSHATSNRSVTRGGIGSPVLTQQGTLVIPGADGRLWAFDATSGAVLWHKGHDVGGGAAAIYRQLALIGDAGGRMRAYDAGTGQVSWQNTRDTLGEQIDVSPVVHGKLVYFALNDPEVLALKADTGSLGWVYRPGVGYFASSSPAVANGVEYIANSDLFAFDASNGRRLWRVSVATSGLATTPTVADGSIFMMAQGDIGAYRPGSGARAWALGVGSADNESAPAVAHGTVFIGSDYGYLWAIDDRTGDLRWLTTLGGPVSSSAAVANGVVYVTADRLYALDESSGEILWSGPLGSCGPTSSSPAVVDGVVYAQGCDGVVYAYHLP